MTVKEIIYVTLVKDSRLGVSIASRPGEGGGRGGWRLRDWKDWKKHRRVLVRDCAGRGKQVTLPVSLVTATAVLAQSLLSSPSFRTQGRAPGSRISNRLFAERSAAVRFSTDSAGMKVAPICCVMPPASPSCTLVRRMLSRIWRGQGVCVGG